MNREDIICMAQEAQMPFYWRTGKITYLDKVERFASLVASAEREACAKLCDGVQDCGPENGCCPTYWNESLELAANAIRARGQA